MYLGVIADDFTGGTDIAGFMVQEGMRVVQYIGVPASATSPADGVVISLKSRSCPAPEAVRDSLSALDWLRSKGCERFYFKYCSTFDSTWRGNIGPVTDALLDALDQDITVIAPALPVNGRTVYAGYLFVNGVPLDESGMRDHPLTPMRDANLMRLIEAQASGKAGNVPYPVLERGAEAVAGALAALHKKGARYAIADALHAGHLDTLAQAVGNMPLVTGGSGLGGAMARQWTAGRSANAGRTGGTDLGAPPGGRCVVLSGSASRMANVQIARYKKLAASATLNVERCLREREAYALELAAWAAPLSSSRYAPMLYATAGPEELKSVQSAFGAEAAGRAIEDLFARLAIELKQAGVDHFIVAGGETSGAVVKALGINAFHIGPQIAPGVPWVRAVDQPVSLALKSGNFGDEDFFAKAQENW